MNGLAEEQAKLKWKKLKEELQKESQLVTKVVEELNQLKKVRFLNFRSFDNFLEVESASDKSIKREQG